MVLRPGCRRRLAVWGGHGPLWRSHDGKWRISADLAALRDNVVAATRMWGLSLQEFLRLGCGSCNVTRVRNERVGVCNLNLVSSSSTNWTISCSI